MDAEEVSKSSSCPPRHNRALSGKVPSNSEPIPSYKLDDEHWLDKKWLLRKLHGQFSMHAKEKNEEKTFSGILADITAVKKTHATKMRQRRQDIREQERKAIWRSRFESGGKPARHQQKWTNSVRVETNAARTSSIFTRINPDTDLSAANGSDARLKSTRVTAEANAAKRASVPWTPPHSTRVFPEPPTTTLPQRHVRILLSGLSNKVKEVAKAWEEHPEMTVRQSTEKAEIGRALQELRDCKTTCVETSKRGRAGAAARRKSGHQHKQDADTMRRQAKMLRTAKIRVVLR